MPRGSDHFFLYDAALCASRGAQTVRFTGGSRNGDPVFKGVGLQHGSFDYLAGFADAELVSLLCAGGRNVDGPFAVIVGKLFRFCLCCQDLMADRAMLALGKAG